MNKDRRLRQNKKGFMKRMLAGIVTACVVLTSINMPVFAAPLETDTRVADPSTMDDWKNYFGENVMSTVNAGGVWTDKSVFTDATAFEGTGITMGTGNDSFLVALSAIASNTSVTGMSNVPTDTMIVLDVSGSMNDNQGNNDLAEEMVDAANESIATLLSTNQYNRVGVVLYSGTSSSDTNNDAAVLLLPLNRYTTGSDGEFLHYSITGNRNTTETVSLDTDVVIENTTTKPTAASKEVVGATYIQKGVILAKDQFVAQQDNTTVQDPVLGTLERLPIMVLMSDGAPTLASTSFTNPGQYNLGDGTSDSTSAALGFVSQLTAAYAKQQIEAVYGDSLFYTLGLGVGNNSVATSVLNPASSSNAINTFWSQYNAAAVGGTVTVQSGNRWQPARTVTKISETLAQNYVDQYFAVDSDSTTDLAAGLKQAFEDIVGAIQLQSRYFPTLVEGSEDISGYISFVDQVGAHMSVTDIKGILIHNTLFSGATLSRNFVTGGGDLGTYDNPTSLGDELVWAVQARLGIDDVDTARTLLGLAYEHGQLSYTSDTEFSNYIGWYANAAGEFLGFWHEGITTMPDPTDPTLTDETRPVYTIKSYGYLGEVDEAHGVTESDMMYATVQVREEIQTGIETVTFAVPAALIPVVTYDVTLDENKNLEELAVSGAEHPIRLVYEVALDSEIDEITVSSIVGDEHSPANGSYEFYTNQWETDHSTGYGKANTYSYFSPSRENERYYYTEDSLIYTDTNGTEYEGTTAPDVNGTYYRGFKVYSQNGTLSTKMVYEQVSAISLGKATQHEDGYWYIPAGTVHFYTEEFNVKKAENKTDSLEYSNVPFVDARYNYYVGATLGNNGRITVTPATGIKLSKTVDEVNADAQAMEFEFTISSADETENGTEYRAVRVDASGARTEETVTFNDGKATVKLKDGETLYITGMTAGRTYTIEESESEYYAVSSINEETGKASVDVTLVDKQLSEANFVNTAKYYGDLTIAKEVTHDFGTDYQIPNDKVFTMTVTLTGIGTQNETFDAIHSDASGNTSPTTVTTGDEGTFTVGLKHNEQLEVFDLPEGTVATVVESAPGNGFTPSYWDNGVSGDGEVSIVRNGISSVIVLNDYTATEVYPVEITVSGTKTLTGRDWTENDLFTFHLQKWNAENQTWSELAEATVKGSDADRDFDFNGAFGNERYTEIGTYYYRVIEVIPETGALGGITYDRTVHSFGVIVGDENMDGALEITEVRPYRETVHVEHDGTTWNVDTDFTNTYSATGSATVSIDLNKVVTDENGNPLLNSSLAGFKFGLYNADDTLAYESEETTDRGFARLVMTYEVEGIYKYTLKEIKPNPVPTGWEYSTVEIPITVVIGHDGNGNLTSVIYQGEGDTPPADAADSIVATFTNIYNPVDAELSLDVDKTISGRTLKAGEFTFEIRPYGSEVAVATGTNDADGNVNFKKLTFNEAGTYFYDVLETSTDGNGVTTDKTVRRVMVTVIDNNGTLEAEYSVVNVAGNAIVFNNTYVAEDVDYVIEGTKVLNGRVLLNDEFAFTLTEASDAQGTIPTGAKTWETRNFADGSFKFGALNFTTAGDYYYVLSEVQGSTVHGVQYDTTKYIIKIPVTDNGVGSLEIDSNAVSINVIGGSSVDNIIFTNNYVPAPISVPVSGNKVLEGKLLTGGIFEFELYEANSSWQIGRKLETVSNLADGSINFTAIEYDKAGTSYYMVKEVNGGSTDKGIAYDNTVYRVRIDITDDLRGKLEYSVTVFDNYGVPQEAVEFVNIYDPTDVNFTATVTKTYVDKDKQALSLTDGAFNFKLTEVDEEGIAVTDGTALEATNDSTGKVEFDIITLSKAGTYYYIVEEVAGNANDIKYDSTVYKYKVVVTDDGEGTLSKAVTLYKSTDGDTFEEVDSEDGLGIQFENVALVVVEPDVSAVKTQSVNGGKASTEKQTVKAGDKVTYQITVTNNGELEATGITITDKIPAGLTVEGAISNGGVAKDGIITWTIDSLEAGESITVSFTVTVPEVDKDTTWTNVASVAYENDTDDKDEESNEVTLVEEYVPSNGSPQTGDNASTAMWSTLMFGSLMICGALLIIEKKRRSEF